MIRPRKIKRTSEKLLKTDQGWTERLKKIKTDSVQVHLKKSGLLFVKFVFKIFLSSQDFSIMLKNDPYLFGCDDFHSKRRLFHQFASSRLSLCPQVKKDFKLKICLLQRNTVNTPLSHDSKYGNLSIQVTSLAPEAGFQTQDSPQYHNTDSSVMRRRGTSDCLSLWCPKE